MKRLRLRALPGRFIPRRGHAVRGALWLAILMLAAVAQHGQNAPHPSFQQPIGQPLGGGINDIPDSDSQQSEEQLRIMNKERQKSLVSDANKLLKLAGELDAELKTSTPDSLTAEQLRKLADIEKLAHNVKDKMSYSVRPGPVFHQPEGPTMR